MQSARGVLVHVESEGDRDCSTVGFLEGKGETVKAAQVKDWGAVRVEIESDIVGAAELQCKEKGWNQQPTKVDSDSHKLIQAGEDAGGQRIRQRKRLVKVTNWGRLTDSALL